MQIISLLYDSTSYFITLPLNEVSHPQVKLKEFTACFSSNELIENNPLNAFTFSLDGSEDAASAFALTTMAVNPTQLDTVVSVSNALVTTGDGSGLDFGVNILTLSVASSVHMVFYPIVNFTISIVEGKFLLSNALYIH